MDRIGIRELRQYASTYLRRVANGESFEVTDRGRLVARLVPIEGDTAWSRLVASGRLRQAGAILAEAPAPVRPPRGKPLPSEVLEKLRRHER